MQDFSSWLEGRPRVAILIDGDNLSPDLAGEITKKSENLGALTIRRVYGCAKTRPRWERAPGFRFIHAGSGKNAADVLLSLDALEVALGGLAETFVIASSDQDLSHIARRLRERGRRVIGMGEAKAPAAFRKACGEFVELALVKGAAAHSTTRQASSLRPDAAMSVEPPKAPRARSCTNPPVESNNEAATKRNYKPDRLATSNTDAAILELLAAAPQGMLVAALGARMNRIHVPRGGSWSEQTWHAYLLARPDLCDCDPGGPLPRVRLRSASATPPPCRTPPPAP